MFDFPAIISSLHTNTKCGFDDNDFNYFGGSYNYKLLTIHRTINRTNKAFDAFQRGQFIEFSPIAIVYIVPFAESFADRLSSSTNQLLSVFAMQLELLYYYNRLFQ